MMKICNESIMTGSAEPYVRPNIGILLIDIERGFASTEDSFDMEPGDWDLGDEDYGGSAD